MTQRPQSRGMGNPLGPVAVPRMGTGMAGMPPGTAGFRGPGGMPPGTGMGPGSMMGGPGGIPPGTGMRVPGSQAGRPNSGRTRTGQVGQPLGVGMATEVKVEQRLVTQQGMRGVKTGGMGPGRQIYDKSYYTVKLREKIGELAGEMNKFNKEIAEIQQDSTHYQSLEKRYDQLIRTVRSLEGDLADYNLALDKQRTDTKPEEIHHMLTVFKNQNDQQRSEVDEIFLEKKSHEEEIRKMNEYIEGIKKASEARLEELHPDQQEEYESLQRESSVLNSELSDNRDMLEEVSGRLGQLEGRLATDSIRTRAKQLRDIGNELLEKRDQLQVEASQAQLSIPEQREILLAKVKGDNAEIVSIEKSITELRMEIEKCRKQIQEISSEEKEKEGGQNSDQHQQKYEILFTKDQEITEFINGFDESKATEDAKIKEKQASIVVLLENISKSIGMSNVDQKEAMKDMKDELEFKNKQLQNSETTQNRLQAELEKRNGELEKMNSLNEKISGELQQLESKISQYQDDIDHKFDRIDDMRKAIVAQVETLQARKSRLEGRLDNLKKQVGFLKLRHDGKKQQLLEDGTNSGIESQEQKIKQFEQNLFHLRVFIATKNAESDYQSKMTTCMDMADEINKILQQKATAF